MATVEQKSLTVAEVLENALERMGDLSGAQVTVIDYAGDFSGNEKAARLMEIFQGFSNGKKQVTLVTGDLTQDSGQQKLLFGAEQGQAGAGKGLLGEKFAAVQRTGLRYPMLSSLAEKMIDESGLDFNMQLGLKVIVNEDISRRMVSIDGGIGDLRRHVNSYLKKPMTPEWSAELLAKSPFLSALDRFSNGCSEDLHAPTRATFRKKGQTP